MRLLCLTVASLLILVGQAQGGIITYRYSPLGGKLRFVREQEAVRRNIPQVFCLIFNTSKVINSNNYRAMNKKVGELRTITYGHMTSGLSQLGFSDHRGLLTLEKCLFWIYLSWHRSEPKHGLKVLLVPLSDWSQRMNKNKVCIRLSGRRCYILRGDQYCQQVMANKLKPATKIELLESNNSRKDIKDSSA